MKFKIGQRVRVEYTGVVTHLNERSVTVKTESGVYYAPYKKDIKEVLAAPVKVGDKFRGNNTGTVYEIARIEGNKCVYTYISSTTGLLSCQVCDLDTFENIVSYTRMSSSS